MNTDICLSPLTPEMFTDFTQLYEQSFPESERKPLSFMLDGECAHAYKLWVVSIPDVPVAGLVITVTHGDFVMLDYLAIDPALRGQGLGHQVLHTVRLANPNTHLFLEIESPTTDAPNLEERLRRKKFYTSAGLIYCDVCAHVYDTDMELWAYPQSAQHIDFSSYAALFDAYFPQDMPRPVEL